MARPRVADRGDDPQIWRIAANTLNSSRGQQTSCSTPTWRLGEGLITPYSKKPDCYEMLHKTSTLYGFFVTTKITENGYGKVWTGCVWLRIVLANVVMNFQVL